MEKEQFARIMKALVESDPQTMVSFILKEATYEGELNRKAALEAYEGPFIPEFEEQLLSADELYHVRWDDEQILLHIEFQRYGETEVQHKLWEQNVSTTIITGRTVYTVIIYGVPEPAIPGPVYEMRLPNGQVNQSFFFDQIKLWELGPEVFEQPQFIELLALQPLTKKGQSLETLERLLGDMEASIVPQGPEKQS